MEDRKSHPRHFWIFNQLKTMFTYPIGFIRSDGLMGELRIRPTRCFHVDFVNLKFFNLLVALLQCSC